MNYKESGNIQLVLHINNRRKIFSIISSIFLIAYIIFSIYYLIKYLLLIRIFDFTTQIAVPYMTLYSIYLLYISIHHLFWKRIAINYKGIEYHDTNATYLTAWNNIEKIYKRPDHWRITGLELNKKAEVISRTLFTPRELHYLSLAEFGDEQSHEELFSILEAKLPSLIDQD